MTQPRSPAPDELAADSIRPRKWSPFTRRTPPLAERVSALKERIYALFTGLAIVTVFALDESHASADQAFFTLLAGIVGITLAGFAAEVISHLVSHRALPDGSDLRTMARVSLGAIGSASIALISLASAWLGLFELKIALQVSIGIYLLTLGLIALPAAHRTGLSWRHQLIALVGLFGLGAAVVIVLILAH